LTKKNIVFEEKLKLIPKQTRRDLWEFTKIYQDAGYECYLVGGSCRDLMLDQEPHDFDFATNCPIPETKKLFRKVIATGEDHGTVTILWGSHSFEVTRYRKDVETDGRRAVVAFSDSIEEDQHRRDLRINAMAYDIVSGTIVDSQNGLQDIQDKVIRFVGNAGERVREDHLRALRYVRILTRFQGLGFQHNPSELEEVIQLFDSNVLSLERIYEEFGKLFKLDWHNQEFLLETLPRMAIFRRFFPIVEEEVQLMHRVIQTRSLFPLYLRYHLEHDLKKTIVDMKLTRKQRWLLLILTDFTDKNLRDPVIVKELMSRIKQEEFSEVSQACMQQFGISPLAEIQKIQQASIPYHMSHLALTAKELQSLGAEGKAMGLLLRYLLEQVWKTPELNTKDQLTSLATPWLQNYED